MKELNVNKKIVEIVNLEADNKAIEAIYNEYNDKINRAIIELYPQIDLYQGLEQFELNKKSVDAIGGKAKERFYKKHMTLLSAYSILEACNALMLSKQEKVGELASEVFMSENGLSKLEKTK